MSEGFRNPIIGGGGGLVYPSIHSPNFITGSAGWTNNKDGSAEFNNVTVRGTVTGGKFIGTGGGQEVLIYSGTPAAGNLILADVSANFTDAFGNQGFTGLNILTAFSAGQARLFNVAGGSGQNTGIQWYYSTVGQNTWNVGAALAPQVTTQLVMFADAFSLLPVTSGVHPSVINTGGSFAGASFQASSFMTTPAMTVTNQEQLNSQSSAPGSSVGNSVLYSDINGILSALLSTDGNIYSLLKATKTYDGPGQTVNSVAFTQVGALSLAVLSGVKYRYKAMVFYAGNQVAGNPILSFGHPALGMTNVWAHEEWSLSGAAVSQTNSDVAFLDVQGPALNTGRTCYTSEGEFQPSANGNLILSAACTVAADTWTIQRAFLEIEPTEG